MQRPSTSDLHTGEHASLVTHPGPDARPPELVPDKNPGTSPSRRRWLVIGLGAAILVIVAVAVGAGVGVSRSRSTQDSVNAGSASTSAQTATTAPTATSTAGSSMSGATVLPSPGKFWIGVSIGNSTVPAVNAWTLGGKGGVKPIFGHAYIYLTNYSTSPFSLTTKAQLVTYMESFFGGLSADAVYMFTVEPMTGISVADAPDSQIQAMADAWKEFNSRGHRVLVRLAHEMNGGWFLWGRQPTAYKAFWIRFSKIVKATAPATSLVWGPTISDSYPWDQKLVPAVGTDDFKAIDTNGNGVLDAGDDPYSPYWPGDEYVDWVAGSLYYYGVSYPYVDNYIPDSHFIEWILTGKNTVSGAPVAPSFYDVYCGTHKKPFIFAETGIYHWPNGAGASELDQKQAYWRLILSKTTLSRFPMIRGLGWFEIAKEEPTWGNQYIDFTIGNNATIMQAFLDDVTANGKTAAAAGIDPTIFEWGS